MNISHLFGTIFTSFLLFFHPGSSSALATFAPGVQTATAPSSQVGQFTSSGVTRVLAAQDFSLEDRYKVPWVNTVFADNILLTLSYMAGQTKDGQTVDWNKVTQPSRYEFQLKPGETFAFHDQILDQYKSSVVKTTNAHFSSTEAFKSDGYLVGDGVCHLASFINLVSTIAGLSVDAPTNHNFAAIPDVSKQYGTAIYYKPGATDTSSKQNLYVTNTSHKTIAFVFNHTQDSLKIAVEQLD